MPELPSPIDILREAAAGPLPADSPEYGLGTEFLPVSNTTAPLNVQLRGGPTQATVDYLASRLVDLEDKVARIEAEVWGKKKP